MLRSIRSRITVGSTVIAALVLLALAVVLGEQVRHVAGAAIADQARGDLQSYVADLTKHPDEAPDPPAPGVRVLALSPRGDVVLNTLPAGLTAQVEHAGEGESRLDRAGTSFVVLGQTVTNARGTWRLWSLRDTAPADLALRTFSGVVMLALPVILVLVAIGSWLLVNAALRPVGRLRAAAERIRSSGRPGRLPDDGGGDELAALTATLNRFLEQQQEVVERERRMVADASHELRTPLAVLTTRLELARRHAGDAAALESAVADAQEEVAGLSRLATQLLELSAIDADGSRAEVTPVGAVISELMAAVDRARSLAPDPVRVDFGLGERLDEEACVTISPLAFARVVDNLTTNALNATRAGSIELLLDQVPGRLVLTVSDTGTGFPADFLPRAFERFTRSERSRAEGTAGSGIGLALVRALVLSAGGEVTVSNRPGRGAEAVVALPLAEAGTPFV